MQLSYSNIDIIYPSQLVRKFNRGSDNSAESRNAG